MSWGWNVYALCSSSCFLLCDRRISSDSKTGPAEVSVERKVCRTFPHATIFRNSLSSLREINAEWSRIRTCLCSIPVGFLLGSIKASEINNLTVLRKINNNLLFDANKWCRFDWTSLMVARLLMLAGWFFWDQGQHEYGCWPWYYIRGPHRLRK